MRPRPFHMRRPPDVSDAEYVEDEDEASEKVLKWLKPYADDPDVEEGFKLRLYRDLKGGGENELATYSWEIDKRETAEEIVEQIMEDATNAALRYKGKTKYVVKVVGTSKGVRFSLTVPAEEFEDADIDFEDFDGESPTTKGAFGQAMRHTEVF